MKVVHVAFECAPIYKTGGLGDVVGSLPKELHKLDVATTVVMPGYKWIKRLPKLPDSQVEVFYVESKYFDVYNKRHDPRISAPKYAHFAFLVLEELKRRQITPDIIHCHDWHTGLIPLILKKHPDAFFEKTKTIITIHNISYQGKFLVTYLDTPETRQILSLFDGHQKRVSYLKEGIRYADYVTTVSPNHAREIRTGKVSFGFKTLIRGKRGRFIGILNGLDYTVWNPRHDRLITQNFTRNSVWSGKIENKRRLQHELGLEESADIPLFGFIARLSSQKGIDLLLPLLDAAAKKRLQVVILGKGERVYEKELKKYQTAEHRTWIAVKIGFDEKLAHRIYAGSDFFLIPSHYEPCGLTQMIAMAYGSLPIASAVGGLKDSIAEGKTGYIFEKVTSEELLEKIHLALHLWEDKAAYRQMVERAMRKDFSWKRSARKYLRLYRRVTQT